jgi:hypothetical protein
MKPTFSTLTILTILSIVLILPFLISDLYLDSFRDQAFQAFQVLQSNGYKLITGFIALSFFVVEMLLTLRKRGRKWKISLPGSVIDWRRFHIFLGIAFLGVILIHTGGSMGQNYNFYFLLIFFAVTLSAMLGVVVETRLLTTPAFPGKKGGLFGWLGMSRGPLTRMLRKIWLGSHIFLVGAFSVMLGIHIFLAYYFQ